ncbi:retrovirus-related pol polyprotein from transposon TNT 1-94 [Tanacetum coccineum]
MKRRAFLYDIIDEDVYVSQPLGFVDPKFPKKVYKVMKALYGLHQAPRAWTTSKDAQAVEILKLKSNQEVEKEKDVCKRRRDCQSNESEEVSRLVVRKQEVPEELHIEDLFKTSDQSIPEANFPTIDPKIARDAKIARQLQVDLQAEVERERQREEEASKAAIAETYDEVQAGIDADALAAQRSVEIRSRPPTKSQLRNLMMTYLKNMGGYKHSQLKAKTFAEIQGLYERQKRVIDDFKPMDSDDAVKDSKEAAGVHKQKVLEEPNSTKVEVKKEGHEESIKAEDLR